MTILNKIDERLAACAKATPGIWACYFIDQHKQILALLASLRIAVEALDSIRDGYADGDVIALQREAATALARIEETLK